ncbi:MAG TPA: pyridoxal phosphate-dependent aminotransferase [Allosphingosinicella sp.]|nr:pyridoxal phosphate-dependent aminotransferase [Allosphingosinicella sp.]
MKAGRRAMRSDYMHWAKTQPPVPFNLASSEVAHHPLDQLPIAIADLELNGASYYRYPPLRQAIADKSGVAADCVVTADGTSMANFLAMAALIEPGDEVLIEQPSYEPLLAVASFLGGVVRRFPRRAEQGFRLDPDQVGRAVTPRTRLIVITNLHNPSSAYADEEALRAIGEFGVRVLVDEVYLDAAFTPSPRSAFHLGAQFVCTSSLTKVYGLSGLRCGWVLAEPALAERMWRLNDLFGVAQAHAAERLGCIALAHLAEISAQTPALLERNRRLADAFAESRNDLDSVPMAGGLTVFPRLLRGDADALHALLLAKYDTSIVPGRWFGLTDHFRIGIGGATAMLEAGLARIGAALDELG